jgi:hypothetical protein
VHISLIGNAIRTAVGFGWLYAPRRYRRTRGEEVDRRFTLMPIE